MERIGRWIGVEEPEYRVLALVVLGLLAAWGALTGYDNARAGWHDKQTLSQAQVTASNTQAVHVATVAVQGEIARLANETAKAQRLAVWVGVGTAVLGAILGGFAGAVAARIVGAG